MSQGLPGPAAVPWFLAAETLPFGLRWQATLVRRDENHVLRWREPYAQLADGVTFEPLPIGIATNAFARARRARVRRQFRSVGTCVGLGFVWWSRTRQTDVVTGESFWSDDTSGMSGTRWASSVSGNGPACRLSCARESVQRLTGEAIGFWRPIQRRSAAVGIEFNLTR
jgi:hypothetical protein